MDEAKERRGQASTNALFDNRVAVLVGDYVLSTALLHIAYSGRERIVTNLAKLGQTLSNGEILQLSNIQNREVSEDVYYEIIKNKTAALFSACAGIGALSVGATEDEVTAAEEFGHNLGVISRFGTIFSIIMMMPILESPLAMTWRKGNLHSP